MQKRKEVTKLEGLVYKCRYSLPCFRYLRQTDRHNGFRSDRLGQRGTFEASLVLMF